MKQANCPSCGAQVTFRSSASIMAVCDYCRSTLIRHDDAVENIGRMAELLEDASPIQIGSEGRYQGIHFGVIGRIQVKYEQGLWNEWYLQFDNQKSGWLGEANGEYTLTFLTPCRETLPAFHELSAGMNLAINGESYTVIDIEQGQCTAGAGELPFRIGAGYPAPSVDLRSGRKYATLDYSETPPLLFTGDSVDFAALHLTHLRDPRQIGIGETQARAFQCPSCGGTVEIKTPDIQSVTCGHCNTLIGAGNKNLEVLYKFAKHARISPNIPLGAEGIIGGQNYRVIGFMTRSASGGGGWSEYLLHNPTQGFRWLVEYQGHWTYAWPVHDIPQKASTLQDHPSMLFDGRQYQHFERYQGKVSYVLGEFYWRVKVNETATINDYIEPPYILSEEKTGKEITWTAGVYVEPEDVRQTFGLAEPLPEPSGISPNQPWPHHNAYRHVWWSFWLFSMLALGVQVASVMSASDRTVYSGYFDFGWGGSEPQSTPVFDVPEHTGNLHIFSHCNVDNDWAELNMELVNSDTGQSYEINREVSYYHGYDDGYWSEGSPSDVALLSGIPPGKYLLRLDAEQGKVYTHNLLASVQVRRNVPNWHNYFVIEGLMLLFPFMFWWRRATFEAQRWSEGDYPRQTPGEKVIDALDGDD